MKCTARIHFVQPPSRAGEVTLTGRVLPIGGVKEKTLAARRSGVSTLIFPAGNRKDWAELAGACAPDGCTMPRDICPFAWTCFLPGISVRLCYATAMLAAPLSE